MSGRATTATFRPLGDQHRRRADARHAVEVDVTPHRCRPAAAHRPGPGSCNRRTREHLADGKGGFSLLVNLGGPYLLSQGEDELLLGDGDATLMSTADPCSFMHRPPGDVLGLYVSREQIAPLVVGAEDHCLKLIPAGTPALKLLTDYIEMAWHERTTACGHLQHLFVSHVYDLIAVAVGASRDGAHHTRGRPARGAALRHQAGHRPQPDNAECRSPRWPPAPLHAALAAAVRDRGHHLHGIPAGAVACAYRLFHDPRRASARSAWWRMTVVGDVLFHLLSPRQAPRLRCATRCATSWSLRSAMGMTAPAIGSI